MDKATFQEGFYDSVSDKIKGHFNESFQLISMAMFARGIYGDKAEEKLDEILDLTAECMKEVYQDKFDERETSESDNVLSRLFLNQSQEEYQQKLLAMIDGHAEHFKTVLLDQVGIFAPFEKED